jgi:acetoin utilization deacetylase AcuC-like enzyme
VLLLTDPAFLEHDAGRGHPERPERLAAVLHGVESAGLGEALTPIEPRPATRAELRRAHSEAHLDLIEDLSRSGGGRVDADTGLSAESWDAAVLAAGAGLAAIEALDRGEGDAAFLAVRPPGHHATPSRAMGFCLLNNIAVAAAALAERGERVLVVDWDAHHGNGTQDAFYADGRVAYVSMHQWPLYPGTGRADETGAGDGEGLTVNLPFPAGTTGDAYRAAIDDVVVPLAEPFQPTWALLSAGFDAHRADPLTDLGLSAGDYADLTDRVVRLVPPGRRMAFLEGGYDLGARARSAAACVGALAGEIVRPEPATGAGPGFDVVHEVAAARSG